jgi:hypothetical protein
MKADKIEDTSMAVEVVAETVIVSSGSAALLIFGEEFPQIWLMPSHLVPTSARPRPRSPDPTVGAARVVVTGDVPRGGAQNPDLALRPNQPRRQSRSWSRCLRRTRPCNPLGGGWTLAGNPLLRAPFSTGPVAEAEPAPAPRD